MKGRKVPPDVVNKEWCQNGEKLNGLLRYALILQRAQELVPQIKKNEAVCCEDAPPEG